jgi:hypothetical protein
MTDDNIINFQQFIKNPGNSDAACIEMFSTIVKHYLDLCEKYRFSDQHYKLQIRKTVISVNNWRNSAYTAATDLMQREHMGLLKELKISGYY